MRKPYKYKDRHFMMTLPEELWAHVTAHKEAAGIPTMGQAVVDLLYQTTSLNPQDGALYSARLQAAREIRQAVLVRATDFFRGLIAEIEQARSA